MTWAAVGGSAVGVVGGLLSSGPSGAQKRLMAAQQAQTDAQTQGIQAKNAGFNSLWGQAQGLSTDPNQNVAGLSPAQLQAMGMTQGTLGFGMQDLNNLSGQIQGQGNGSISAADIQNFANPATDSLVNATNNDIDLQRQRAVAGNSSNASLAGAFGGDRQAVTDSLTNEAALRQTATADAGIRSTAYQNATQAALQNQNASNAFTLSGNQQLQSLIQARQGVNQNDINNLTNQGQTQQSTDQAMKSWQANRLQLMSGILNGYSPSATNWGVAGPTAAANQPNAFASAVQGAQYGANVGQGIAQWYNNQNGSGSTLGTFNVPQQSTTSFQPYQGASFDSSFSDRRLKKNIEATGEVIEGLPVYDFHYRWDDDDAPKHRGYMADEVMHLFPDAVSEDEDGFMLVDYGKVPSYG